MAEDTSLDSRSNDVSSANRHTITDTSATADPELQTQTMPKEPEDTAIEASYPDALEQSILVIALMLATFIVSLDLSIIATAIPTITKEFHSVEQVGWYGSAFLMCLAMFQGVWSKAYKYFPQKYVFLACIFIFEIGSLVAALAPNSVALIAGRAVQGFGGAGLTSGCYIIAAFIVQPSRLSIVMGLFGAIWACVSVLGPILGGVFTQELTWRWCFWINLPIGGVTFFVILPLYRTPAHSRSATAPSWESYHREFDVLGVVLGLGAWICLFLVLQDGGVKHAWKSTVSIGLLIGFWLLVIAFIAAEWAQRETAMVPQRLLKKCTIAACTLYALFWLPGPMQVVYLEHTLFLFSSRLLKEFRHQTVACVQFLVYFHSVKKITLSSGKFTPTKFAIAFSSLGCSILLGKVGYYQPFLWAGGILITVGSGLYYTLDPGSSAGYWIGYQTIAVVGQGMVIQLPAMVAQKVAARQDLSITVGIVMFAQFIGGGFDVSTGQAIFNNRLINTLPDGGSEVTAAHVLAAGATGLGEAFPNPQDLTAVIASYMIGLRDAWVFTTAMSGAVFIGAFTGEWLSINAPANELEPPVKPTPAREEVKA